VVFPCAGWARRPWRVSRKDRVGVSTP